MISVNRRGYLLVSSNSHQQSETFHKIFSFQGFTSIVVYSVPAVSLQLGGTVGSVPASLADTPPVPWSRGQPLLNGEFAGSHHGSCSCTPRWRSTAPGSPRWCSGARSTPSHTGRSRFCTVHAVYTCKVRLLTTGV